jgi:hypothetical protein
LRCRGTMALFFDHVQGIVGLRCMACGHHVFGEK